MEINSNRFFLHDVYSYDISACNYNMMLENRNDVSRIDFDDKLKRNISIGYIARDDRFFNAVIRASVIKTVDTFLFLNKIKQSDIILRQFDGLILHKKINYETKGFNIRFEFRDQFTHFLISSDKQMYIGKTLDGKIITKGIPNSYDSLSYIYSKILSINYINKNSIFTELNKIKEEVLSTDDIELFLIPLDSNHYTIIVDKYGKVNITKNLASLISADEIDREWYFDKYIRPFTESVCIEFL